MPSVKRTLRDIDEYITNLSIGLGSGITSQLQGVYDMVTNPVQTARGLYQVASNPGQIPGMVRNALADAAMRGTSGPMGLGEVVGENIGFRTPKGPTKLDATVYHGSPHNFDKFDMSRIGTGEGAQMYGHGLYFADEYDVAATYAPRNAKYEKNLMRKYNQALEAQDYTRAAVYEDAMLHASPAHMRQKYTVENGYSPESIAKYQEIIKREIEPAYKRNSMGVYKVDLPDEQIAQMLDWDKPLVEQPHVVAAFKKAGLGDDEGLFTIDGHVPYDGITGGSAYEQIMWQANQVEGTPWAQGFGNPAAAASAHLKSLGIPGIRYFDQGSRAMGSGTRNYVVFDDQLPKILGKE